MSYARGPFSLVYHWCVPSRRLIPFAHVVCSTASLRVSETLFSYPPPLVQFCPVTGSATYALARVRSLCYEHALIVSTDALPFHIIYGYVISLIFVPSEHPISEWRRQAPANISICCAPHYLSLRINVHAENESCDNWLMKPWAVVSVLISRYTYSTTYTTIPQRR